MFGFGEDFSQLLEGEPDAVVSRSERLSHQAQAIADAARTLTDLASGQIAKSATEVRSRSADVQTAMLQAQQRYDETATALKTYGVKLGPIKSQAARDIDALERARERAGQAEYAAGDAQRRQMFERLTNSPADVQQDTADDLARAQRQAHAAQAEVQEILRRLRAAVDEKERIAQSAINAIEAVTSRGKDSFLDNLAQAFEGIGDFFAAIGKWISEVAKQVVDAIVDIVQRLASVLVMAVLALAALALVGLVLGIAAAIGGPVVAFLIGAAILAVPVVVGGLLLNIVLGEVLGPDPKPYDHDSYVAKNPAQDYGDIIEQVAKQDAKGLDDYTDIKIVKIYDEHGNLIAARVQSPSTQSWSPFDDHGAYNDLRADAMIAMTPGLKSQYERAVLDAMQQAGLDQTDVPIMMVGWSLGGMVNGEVASDANSPYAGRIVSLVSGGSAVDKYRSDLPDVRVTQFNNPLDPVHRLEFVNLGPGDSGYNPNWVTHHTPFVLEGDGYVHNGSEYARQADLYQPEMREGDEIFIAGDGGYEQVEEFKYSRDKQATESDNGYVSGTTGASERDRAADAQRLVDAR